jgi:preprotein translocase subunit SecD
MVFGEKMKLTWRIWLLLVILLMSVIMIFNINNAFSEGVIIKDISTNTSEFHSGLRQGDIIIRVNENKIENFEDYSKAITSTFESSGEKKVVIDTKNSQYVFFTDKVPEITVSEIPKTNIQAGLDLQGGARALVKPEKQLNSEQMDELISVSQERFNVYGISDVNLRSVRDLQGNTFMLVEIAGATPNDIENLISQQGKFEAKIGEEVVFTGGNNDLTYVCRNDANCASVTLCQQSTNGGWFCNYEFSVSLSQEAAQRHADITRDLGIDPTAPGYLEKQIDFYVDDVLTNSLFISESLKGQVTTQIQIQGSGSGADRESAFKDAENSMKQQQTILITGSLPYKLEIEKLDTISPLLGGRFTQLIFLTGVAALLSVSIIVFFRYKSFKASLALLFTSFSELLILLAVAAGLKWNLDLPSIVGILVMIGTGVDQQIIILDESLSKKQGSMNQKIRGALFIVIAAYFTTFFSLIPLFYAGAGLLRGFALTTLVGLTIGVLITRPAFADMLKLIDKQNASK